MTRRDFFRRASVIAAGLVAADQLELLDRLSHRKVWALGGMPKGEGAFGAWTGRYNITRVERSYVDQFGRECSLPDITHWPPALTYADYVEGLRIYRDGELA